MKPRIKDYGSVYAVWLEGRLQEQLRKIAKDRKTTMARIVREFITQGIDRAKSSRLS